MKKLLTILIPLVLALASSCNAAESDDIWVISREDGSGTRGAFVELLDIYRLNSSGGKSDAITGRAEITNSTSVMMTTISASKNAIGYISLGSLNDTVSAVSVDGIAPSTQSIKDGSYKITRAFNVVSLPDLSDASRDFLQFILSRDGQATVEQSGYIAYGNPDYDYSPTVREGKITIAGSSSVAPVMERLKEQYNKLNPSVTVEIQQNDSTTGIASARQGICDIGMSSRELKQSESAAGLKSQTIALDGIAIIVNNNSSFKELNSRQIKEIFSGEITKWSQLNKQERFSGQ